MKLRPCRCGLIPWPCIQARSCQAVTLEIVHSSKNIQNALSLYMGTWPYLQGSEVRIQERTVQTDLFSPINWLLGSSHNMDSAPHKRLPKPNTVISPAHQFLKGKIERVAFGKILGADRLQTQPYPRCTTRGDLEESDKDGLVRLQALALHTLGSVGAHSFPSGTVWCSFPSKRTRQFGCKSDER
jgi:hypothetical protein